MLGRLTETEPEDWPTVDPETLVSAAVHDASHMRDDDPCGWVGGVFYPEDGLLVLTYQKYGNDMPPDEDGVRYADTGLGLLTVDRVVDLVWEAGRMDTKDDVRAWVLGKLG